jgi:hypothetical protein
MRKLQIHQYALFLLHLAPYRGGHGWTIISTTTTTTRRILGARRQRMIIEVAESRPVSALAAAAKRRQRGGGDSSSSSSSNNNQDDDMNRWYDSVDANASPDDVFWGEMQRQNLLAAAAAAAAGSPDNPTSSSSTSSSSSSSNALLGGGGGEQQPQQSTQRPPPSFSSAFTANSRPPFRSSRGGGGSGGGGSGGGNRNLDNINSLQEQQQNSMMSQDMINGDEEKPKITPKAAEATLKEYATYQVADNWLDEELVELVANQQRNKGLWDDNAPSVEEQMEAWDRDDQDKDGDEEDGDDDVDDDNERTDEPWDTWNNPRDGNKPLLDANHPSMRNHIITLDNMHDDDTAEDIEVERQYRARQARLTIASRRLERARNNPQARSYFQRPPDALQGYDQMWVAAIDYACFKNLGGVFRDYGVFMSLKTMDTRFDYRIAKDKFGATCGYCWQTPVMRADLEQYGDVLFLDAMKRQQNSLYWPYIGPVVIDGDKKVRVIAESIVCTERLESYQFVLESVFSMTPGFDKSSIRLIFGDGIMGQSLLQSLGIETTCHLGYDAYHLFNKDWPDHFNKLWSKLQDNFEGLLYAAGQEQFDSHVEEIKLVLADHPRHLDYLQREVLDHQKNFARHHLRAVKGKLLWEASLMTMHDCDCHWFLEFSRNLTNILFYRQSL